MTSAVFSVGVLCACLLLPNATATATPTAYAHNVRTLTSQTYDFLTAARHPDPSPIKGGGDVLVLDGKALVPDRSIVSAKQSSPEKSFYGEIALYIVREGDTLSQIAEMYGVTENTIRWANDIGVKGTIRPDDTLLILPINGVQHTVVKGDTIASIAKKYKGDEDEIRAFNGIAPDGIISIGDVLTIPGGEIAPPPAPARTPTSSVGTSVGTAPTISGYYAHPIPGALKTQGIHGYNGVDFGASHGTPIRASAPGRVIVSRVGGWNGGYGNYVVIEHENRTQTLYAHNSSNIVSVGQQVHQGQVIGYVGSTGRSTGPHLHFEVRGARNPF